MAITSDELQSIVSAVLSSIRTNSRTIDQLTPVTALADTDNLEVHGGKRVVFSILRNLILSKSGVDELKTELKPKLAKLDDVVEIHSVRSDIGVILAQPSGPLTVYHGSTDEGYGVVYDSTRKRFYLVGTSALSNPNTDVSAIQAYGDWSDEAIFGDSPESGSGRVPVRGKIYVCATDGGLYYWNGTDLVDLIKGILANTNALSVLNRRGQVEPFAAILTSDPDDDPIPEELAGKRIWSTQFNKFLEINIGGDPPYREPEDSAAVVDKFYVCDGRLYLGVKVSQTATTLKPLFDSEIEQLSRTHSITLTAGDDGTLSWSGPSFDNIRQGDVLQWEDPEASIQLKAVVVTGLSLETQEDYRPVGALFTYDGDETNELRLLWLYPNGSVREACFLSEDRINEELKKVNSILDAEREQFGYIGFYLKANGSLTNSSLYRNSGLLPLNRMCALTYKAFVASSAASVCFFDATRQFISGVQNTKFIETTITIDEFPDGAVWFAVNTAATAVNDSYWVNGKTIESREGAVSQAIQASKFALFDDEWTAAGGIVIVSGVTYGLNGIDDLTYKEAMEIWKMSYHHCLPVISIGVGSAKVYPPYVFGGSQNFCRTYLPVMLNANYEVIADYMFASNNMVETILILDNGSAVVSFSSSKSIFRGCVKLRKIISKLYFKQHIISSDSEFDGCSSLENVDITFYIGGRSLSFAQSARLSLDSLKKMVLQARWLPSDSSHTSTSTITVHPDVFAKLTDETNAEWHQVLIDAVAKNISFATI